MPFSLYFQQSPTSNDLYLTKVQWHNKLAITRFKSGLEQNFANNLRQVVHIDVPATKQDNLVLTMGW